MVLMEDESSLLLSSPPLMVELARRSDTEVALELGLFTAEDLREWEDVEEVG